MSAEANRNTPQTAEAYLKLLKGEITSKQYVDAVRRAVAGDRRGARRAKRAQAA